MESSVCYNESCSTLLPTNIPNDTQENNVDNTMNAWCLCRPCVLLLLLVPLNYLLNRRGKHMPVKLKDRKRWMKMAPLLLMICMILRHSVCAHSNKTSDDVLGSSTHNASNFGQGFNFDLITGWVGSYVLMTSLMLCEIFNLININYVIVKTMFWFTTVVTFGVELCNRNYGSGIATNSAETLLDVGLINFCVAIINCCVSLYEIWSESKERKTKDDEDSDSEWTAQELIGWCIGNITFSWVWGLMFTGYRRNLEIKDIPEIKKKDKSINGFSKFDRNWRIAAFTNKVNADETEKEEQEVTEKLDTSEEKPDLKSKVVNKVSLSKVLIKTFGFKFVLMQLMNALFRLANFTEPYLTKQFMIFVQNRENEMWTNGVRIIFTLFLFNLTRVFYNHRLHFEICKYQRVITSSLKMAVFQKALKVKNECTKDKTTADTVNLMSSECDRIEGMGQRFCFLVSEPLIIFISMLMLYNEVGNATFVGVAILIVFIPFNHYIGKKLTNLGISAKDLEDKRTAAMNEIVNGIKALKLYAWEPYFIAKVNGIRKECEDCNGKKSLMIAFLDIVFRAIPFIVKATAFGTFLFLGGHLDAVRGFTAFHLFHMLNEPFSLLALFLPGFVEMASSMKKIDDYLNNDNIPEDVTERKPKKGKYAVIINDGNFAWERKTGETTTATLKDVNLTIPNGKLVAIVGKVGSGKSSLLSAMLGEMEKLKGRVEIQGDIAYVPQEAWVMNKSLKENILFGSKEDAEHYKRSINASALIKDIKDMAAGDRSEIGEKGINLSGGQKQRVSLARALYRNADVYLFDDPLSAVDAHVGRHIFNKAIGHKSMIKSKTRVLVTHGVHWLPHVDHIIYLKDGRITESGTYKDLTSHHGEFTQFVQHVLTENNEPTTPKIMKTRENIMKRIISITEDPVTQIDMNAGKDPNNNSAENSTDSSGSEEEELKLSSSDNDAEKAAFLEDEEVEQGQVGFQIYLTYAKAVGYLSIVMFMIVYALQTTFDFRNTRVLKEWTEDETLSNRSLLVTKEVYDKTNWDYYYMFVLTGALEVLFAFVYVIIILIASYRAATQLHDTLLNRILRCPMSFFDTTSTAKIVGLFSKDMGKIDELGHCLRWFIAHFLDMCNYLIMILVFCPMLVVCILPFVCVQYVIFKVHSSPATQLRRFSSKYRSPVYAHFQETLNGKESIRAYSCQKEFSKIMENKLDTLNNIDYWEKSVGWWAGMTSMLALRTLQFSIAMFCIASTSMTPGLVGLVTMYATIFCFIVRGFFGLIVHMETEMVALERVVSYSDRQSEAAWELFDKETDCNWPSDGRVNFNNYKTRYAEGSDLVLKGIDCRIEAGQKVGIVGRTGAGKTSLAMSIFRLLEASDGNINICGETIADLGLHDLRSRINILPQDPIIFKGTLRMNLDPAGTKSDEELWKALEHANLYSFVQEAEGKLDFECGEGGKNLSVGQKQLLCLARTLLRNSPILVLDEATAAVDMKTDAIIQSTIRTAFKECTVLTIAHRLNTVLDYDRIMVLDHGRVAEFDSPKKLLADSNSIFYSMVNDVDNV